MAVWLVRAGANGEFEQKFIEENRVYIAWDGLDVNVAHMSDREELVSAMAERYPDRKTNAIRNWSSQVWPFAHAMQPGDLVIVPLKSQPAIQIGEVTSGYHFEPSGPNPFYHWRTVHWIGEAIPRTNFAQDILYTLGAFMTICRVQRNEAEARLAAMRSNGWRPESTGTLAVGVSPPANDLEEEEASDTDLESLAHDQIARLISSRFKGHALSRLVDAILQAQGYTTYVSPEGPDGGVDILAGSGPLGFGAPRLCVEVKSGDAPVDRSTVDKLLGAMTKFGANEGLFVSWSGFKSNVHRELAGTFFRMRLWSQRELLEALFAHYDHLDEGIKAELPLKRVWSVAAQSDT